MKLITLNAWGGKLRDPLLRFIESRSREVDVFCFQDLLFGSEAGFTAKDGGRINIFEELRAILADFDCIKDRADDESHFHSEALDPGIGCGRAIFIRKPLDFHQSGGFKTGDTNLWEGGTMVSGKHQWATFSHDGSEYALMNVHGLWQSNSLKRDTLERIEQSKNIRNFFAQHGDKKRILCGDLNIAADTEAIRILEEGMVNLVKLHGVTSTRSSHYPKEGKFADYVFISPDVAVREFRVLEDEVSDHLPLYLDFQ